MKIFVGVFCYLGREEAEFGDHPMTIQQIEMKACKEKKEEKPETEISFFKQTTPDQQFIIKRKRDEIDKAINKTVRDVFQEPGIVMQFIGIVLEVREDIEKKKIYEEEKDFQPDVFVAEDLFPGVLFPGECFRR